MIYNFFQNYFNSISLVKKINFFMEVLEFEGFSRVCLDELIENSK